MKKLFSLIALLVTLDCESQIATNEFKIVLVTNWVKPGEFLRVVNGQLYNTAYSKLWNSPGDLIADELNFASDRRWTFGTWHNCPTKIVSVETNQIVCGVYLKHGTYEPDSGVMHEDGDDFIANIIIRNYPNPFSLVTGEELVNCRCMRSGNYIENGVSCRVYDCGIQSTNLVPVITKTQIRITNTNSVLAKP